jgi:hypothetical protein
VSAICLARRPPWCGLVLTAPDRPADDPSPAEGDGYTGRGRYLFDAAGGADDGPAGEVGWWTYPGGGA